MRKRTSLYNFSNLVSKVQTAGWGLKTLEIQKLGQTCHWWEDSFHSALENISAVKCI